MNALNPFPLIVAGCNATVERESRFKSHDEDAAEARAREIYFKAEAVFLSACQDAQALTGCGEIEEQFRYLFNALSDNAPTEMQWQEAIARKRS